MNSLNFFRVIKRGVVNFHRNGWLSIATICIMTMTLFVTGGLFITTDLFQTVANELQDKIDITAYFNEDAPETQILEARKFVLQNPEVRNVEYISKEEAYRIFKESHKDNDTIVASLQELQGNPLPASLNIKAVDPKNYARIAASLRDSQFNEYIQKINDKQNENAIANLSSIISTTKKIGLFTTIILSVIVILVTFNTIRLTIYIHKNEIEIMKLVGGTNWFIRAPFIVEGILYGFLSSVAAIGILYLGILVISSRVTGFLPSSDLISFYRNNFWMLILLETGGGAVLGSLSSFIAIKKYLKV